MNLVEKNWYLCDTFSVIGILGLTVSYSYLAALSIEILVKLRIGITSHDSIRHKNYHITIWLVSTVTTVLCSIMGNIGVSDENICFIK